MKTQQINYLISKNFNKIFNAINQELNIRKPNIYIANTNNQYCKIYNSKTFFRLKIKDNEAKDYMAVSFILRNEILFNATYMKNFDIDIKDEILKTISHELWHLYENSYLYFIKDKKNLSKELIIREQKENERKKQFKNKYYMQIKNYMYKDFRKEYLTDFKIKSNVEYLTQNTEIQAYAFSEACRNKAPFFHIMFKEIYDIDTKIISENLENIKWTLNSSMKL
jgi:hypothetical protein